ncbi:MAG: arginine--tRNA ligase [Pseudomonadota bacterium]
MTLQARLSKAFGDAFAALGHDPALGAVVESSKGDAPFQCNGAMAAAGAAKKRGEKANPRDIATAIAARLSDHPMLASLEVAGPGFLNVTPSGQALSETARAIAADPVRDLAAGSALTIVIDYGGANVAKPMHVGHLRSAVIGEALKRILRARSHTVIGDAHLGDWGLQMGHLISELETEQPDLPYFDEAHEGDYPSESPVTMEDLARLYPQASNSAKSDEARMERSRLATAELQAGRRGYRALLDHFIDVSVAALKDGYGRLGVEFDLWNGEMCVDPLIPGMIDDLDAQGLTREDDGALIIDVDPDYDQENRKGTPPLMVKARTGAVLYATTDLATLIDRKHQIDPDLLLYVVDQRQANHFEQVFRAAARAGWFRRDQMEHVGFGTMNGADGKPFKTRDGGVLRLEDLLETMQSAAEKRLAEAGVGADFDPSERAEIARKVGLAALKFADLQNARLTNYVFDPDRFTAFEGKTGPYLLYAAVRIKSILRKAAETGVAAGAITPDHEAEAALVLALDAYPRALTQAAEKRAPHILCDHVYNLAQTFSRFYSHCPILADGVEPDVQASRLALAKVTLEQLEHGLGLLGIKVPERM